ncbi:8-amino-7-oxononanoate synthase [Erythrobacter mangrovi]|uniref:8-amino-7-oxononanoate synthase n=1 Tax=Erythrobacter mangrovi TaxID=2739433 RepID=UPI001F1AC781|nr:8-amino-7-oxononanoate synthase [Erythrobacter mangrovi]
MIPQIEDLEGLEGLGRLRTLAPRQGVDFASNDYLALAGSRRLAKAAHAALERGVPTGSGGSRLLRGNHPEHEALEVEAARFFGSEAAIWFATGFAANSALLSTLPQRGDCVFHDELVHASAHEGLRLSRAEARAVPHNDAQAIDDGIHEWRRAGAIGTPWIVVESLYSMDGDHAPLAELAWIAERHGAILVVDDAHATGVFGPNGRGLAAGLEGRDDVIVLHTLGKALGCEGALLTGPRAMRDHLVNRGRGFIFSTAPSPLMAAVAREALRICADEPERRRALQSLVDHAARVLEPLGARVSGSQILPLVIGDDKRTMEVARRVQQAGFDLRGIRPPTVPEGTSRLRISLTLNVTQADVDALAVALREALG